MITPVTPSACELAQELNFIDGPHVELSTRAPDGLDELGADQPPVGHQCVAAPGADGRCRPRRQRAASEPRDRMSTRLECRRAEWIVTQPWNRPAQPDARLRGADRRQARAVLARDQRAVQHAECPQPVEHRLLVAGQLEVDVELDPRERLIDQIRQPLLERDRLAARCVLVVVRQQQPV